MCQGIPTHSAIISWYSRANSRLTLIVHHVGFRTAEDLSGSDGGYLVVFEARYCEAQHSPSRRKGTVCPACRSSTDFTFTPSGSFIDGLRAERVDRLHPAMVRVGVGVVEQVHGIARLRLPAEHLDEAVALNVDDALVMGDPADGVVEQPQQITVTGEPVAALDVSGELGHSAEPDSRRTTAGSSVCDCDG